MGESMEDDDGLGNSQADFGGGFAPGLTKDK